MTKDILVAVAWPYANNDLHLGHLAGAFLPADIFARYHRLAGNRVLAVSGSDAHGTPITLAADAAGLSPRELFTHYHRRFLATLKGAGISFDLYTHTDTENHSRVAQDLFLRLHAAGHIFPAKQTLLYSSSSQRFLPDRYLVGSCPHCGQPGARGDQCEACGRLLDATELINPRSVIDYSTPELRETEHFFLNLPKFADDLLRYYGAHQDHWRPHVLNFSRRYVLDGLRPRPITRDLDWGIPVPLPGWEGKKLYIWFENVIGYLSAAIEWAENNGDPEAWRSWWTNPEARSYYFLGQDNVPFHAVTWPAQLLGAAELYQWEPGVRLQLPYDVPANRQYTLQSREFSKSKWWAVWLNDALAAYHPDAVRYVVAATLPENSDSDFTWAEFVRRNNGELVATWGNLVHRVLSFAFRHWGRVPEPGSLTAGDQQIINATTAAFDRVGELIAAVKLRAALQEALRLAQWVNGYLSETPWYSVIEQQPERAATTVYTAIQAISGLNVLLSPFLPFGAEQVRGYLGQPPLFGRQEIVTISEKEQYHEALIYDRTAAGGSWSLPRVPAGQALPRPEPLYVKLKPPS